MECFGAILEKLKKVQGRDAKGTVSSTGCPIGMDDGADDGTFAECSSGSCWLRRWTPAIPSLMVRVAHGDKFSPQERGWNLARLYGIVSVRASVW